MTAKRPRIEGALTTQPSRIEAAIVRALRTRRAVGFVDLADGVATALGVKPHDVEYELRCMLADRRLVQRNTDWKIRLPKRLDMASFR